MTLIGVQAQLRVIGDVEMNDCEVCDGGCAPGSEGKDDDMEMNDCDGGCAPGSEGNDDLLIGYRASFPSTMRYSTRCMRRFKTLAPNEACAFATLNKARSTSPKT